MGENSNIAWTTHTFSPWIGCQKVSTGCDNCYAETLMDKRYHRVTWGPHGERVRTSPANWKLPLRWARKAREAVEDFEAGMLTLRPERPRVFCASLADWLDNQVPRPWRTDLWQVIEATPELDWLLLTKRPENYDKLAPWHAGSIPKNIWLGATCEDQANFNRRWPILSRINCAVKFISYEPAIGSLTDIYATAGQAPDWIICGGESGASPREMDPEWARDLRDQCEEAGVRVPFFMKQMTGRKPIPEDLMVQQFPRAS